MKFESMFTPTMSHMSNARCHMSGVTCHVSCVMCQVFFDKVMELVGGGSVINGAYRVLNKDSVTVTVVAAC